MARLLHRIKERVAEPLAGRTKHARAVALPRPATASEIVKAESRLGLKLPSLLKTLYTEVANGGFGPGQGFLGVPSRKSTAGLNLVKAYRNCGGRAWQWPAHLLPAVYAGCDVFFCIDCDDAKNRVTCSMATSEAWTSRISANLEASGPIQIVEWLSVSERRRSHSTSS